MNFLDQVGVIIDKLNLEDETDNLIIKYRFLNEVSLYENKKEKTKKWYNGFRFVVTIGSILIPGILSIGQMDPDKLPKNFNDISYWASWIISLSVTMSNGFIQLFSLDKNYFSYSIVTEQLKTEGWQFFQLSGKYEDFPDHSSAYKSFCKAIENIKRKQIEQEFSSGKAGDKKKEKFDFEKSMNKNLSQTHKFKPQTQKLSDLSNIMKEIGQDNGTFIEEEIKQNVIDKNVKSDKIK